MSKKRSNNNYYREIDKDNYINNYNSIKAGIQGDNKKSEVTQKYTRIKYDDSIDKDSYINNYNSIKVGIQSDNKKSEVTQKYDRTNYDDSKAKERHKDKVYGDNKTTTDKYTGKTIHRDHKAAKNKYKTKASEHQGETDHIEPLKKIHDTARNMSYINDGDVKEIANKDTNLSETSKRVNTRKADKTNSEAAKDNDDLDTKGKAKMVADGVKAEAAVYGELIAKDLGRAGVAGMKSGLQTGAQMNIAKNLVAVFNGDKDLGDAVVDTAVDTAKTTITAGATNIGLEATTVVAKGVVNKLAEKATEKAVGEAIVSVLQVASNNVGKIVTVTKTVVTAINQFLNDDITAEDFFLQLGQAGSDLAAGAIGTAIGTALAGPIGGFLGGLAGYLVSSMFYSAISSVVNGAKIAREKYLVLSEISDAAIRKMNVQREALEKFADDCFKKLDNNMNYAFSIIDDAIIGNDTEKLAEGMNLISRQFGGKAQYNSFEEFSDMMNDDSVPFVF